MKKIILFFTTLWFVVQGEGEHREAPLQNETRAGAQCPPSYTLVGDRCLWFMNNVRMDFLDAADLCDFYGGSLAKLDDCNLLGEIAQFAEANGIGASYWIGATDIAEEGTYVWTDGTEMQMGAPFWAPYYVATAEPQDDGDACVALDPLDGYYFHNEGCTNEFSVICQLDVAENSPCPAPFISVAGGCYQFLDSMSVTWEVGRSSCQDSGGDLAVIDDCSVMTDIIRYIEGAGMSSHFWIGGLKAASSWVWIDGSAMAMGTPFWGHDQTAGLEPNGGTDYNCIILSSGYGYHFADGTCDFTTAPLCEAPREALRDGPS